MKTFFVGLSMFLASKMFGPNPSNSASPADLMKQSGRSLQVRGHEVAVAELNNLSSSRAVYQRNGNIFFLTTIEKATAFEQKQLDSAKARLQKLSSS